MLSLRSKCLSSKLDCPKLAKPSSICSNGFAKGAATPTEERSTTNTIEEETNEETKANIVRSGVYFDNNEIFNTIHPTQVKYKKRHVSKVLNLPVGMPLLKPPRLGATCERFLPPISEIFMDRVPVGTKGDSPSDEEPLITRKRPRIDDRSKEDEPSKSSCVDNMAISNSKKRLSCEEKLFIEAAIALSSSTVPIPSKKKKRFPRKVRRKSSSKPSSQAMPPPPFPFSHDTAPRLLLSLEQKS